jgi:CBS domain-containing protein
MPQATPAPAWVRLGAAWNSSPDLVNWWAMPPVSEQMATELLTVEPTTTLVGAVQQMNARRVGAALVLDDDRLVGVFTERDVLRAVAEGLTAEAVVGDWMTRGPETIEPDEPAEHAAVLMIHGGFRHLPVVEEGKVVGILSIRDLMRAVLHDAAPRGV